MKIYFDVDLFGNQAMDAYLLDIMFGIKERLKVLLRPVQSEIQHSSGFIVIYLKPNHTGFETVDFENSLFKKVQELIKDFDIAPIINQILSKNSN